MNISKYISRWTEKGLITDLVATELNKDVKEVRQSETQSNFIIALSTIGAILAGIGAILFISANWDGMGDMFKVLLLCLVTFGVFISGYYLKYEKQNYTRFGSSLLFLSALLIGATVFLTAQIYNVQADSSGLLLLWFLLMAPLVYLERSFPFAILFSGLSYVWLWFLSDEIISSYSSSYIVLYFLLFSLLWFEFGTLHNLKSVLFAKLARTFRLISIFSAMIWLYVMSFEGFLDSNYYSGYYAPYLETINQLRNLFLMGMVVLFCFMGINYALGLIKSHDERIERLFASISVLTIFYYLSTLGIDSSAMVSIVINLIVFSISIGLIYYGYKREDTRLINIGSFWLGLLILARYFDLFYDLLSTSMFFFVGGIILLAGGFFLERSRRELLSRIKGD